MTAFLTDNDRGGGEACGPTRVQQRCAYWACVEEEPQDSGGGVEGRYLHSGQRQQQLILMDVLCSSLVGRAAKEICEAFDVTGIFALSFGAESADRRVVDQPLA